MAASNKIPKHLAQEIYQLKITLKRSELPIWRRVQVRSEITLAQLHEVIQIAIGWADSHLGIVQQSDKNNAFYFCGPNQSSSPGFLSDRRPLRLISFEGLWR